MNHAVYKNIKKIRELKNLTRDHVADELKMSTSGYGKIERGEVDLTVSKLEKIAEVLDVSIEFIFRFDVSLFFENRTNRKKDLF
ncbi:helix-turn-helix domain-containing protein [Flavobacterium sp. AC]|uniref:Helix-turn-helix domain-containing protein n=1 Tax=Flavobacterium azizsancarii TaxID=2961580 RepID=A0ABT4WG19_9FLAO|nr:helix-turn-helix transcriptional regulator [Flavobacterium azizsancarii]MDA6071539.1 helix-turn-helix domain-containing protein [Flavobacterium azizsancarii]